MVVPASCLWLLYHTLRGATPSSNITTHCTLGIAEDLPRHIVIVAIADSITNP